MTKISGVAAADEYYLQMRASLVSLAADLDRIERLGGRGAMEDFRVASFTAALKELGAGPGRAARVLAALSDPGGGPTAKPDTPKALGAWSRFGKKGAGK